MMHLSVNCNKAGFEIKEFHVDIEFGCLEDHLKAIDIEPNFWAAQEHVPKIERLVRVVKERHGATLQLLAQNYDHQGGRQLCEMVECFPPSGGISNKFSLRTIIIGRPLDYDKHCKVAFGSYVQASNQNNPTKTNEERTINGFF